MAELQDPPDNEPDGASTPPAKKPPAKAAKKAAKAPAKNAPAKKAPAKSAPAKKVPAKAAPAKAAPAKAAPAAKAPEPVAPKPAEQPLDLQQRIETNGQLDAAKDAAAQAKSAVEGANNPVTTLPAVPASTGSPAPLVVAIAVSLLAILLIRQLRRR
jgi:hypothetical protein